MESTVDLIWLVSGYIALGIKAWALSDVIKAPAEAFPFLNRQTKNIGLIACGVYLADIRVKINDMTGRR